MVYLAVARPGRHPGATRLAFLALLILGGMGCQAPLALGLALGLLATLAGKRVLTCLEFDTHRGAMELKLTPKDLLKIALVAVGDFPGLVTVNNDQGRILPARMCVAQLDAPAVYHRWWVIEHRAFQDTGQGIGLKLAGS